MALLRFQDLKWIYVNSVAVFQRSIKGWCGITALPFTCTMELASCPRAEKRPAVNGGCRASDAAAEMSVG